MLKKNGNSTNGKFKFGSVGTLVKPATSVMKMVTAKMMTTTTTMMMMATVTKMKMTATTTSTTTMASMMMAAMATLALMSNYLLQSIAD